MLDLLQHQLSSSGRHSLKQLFALVLGVFGCGYVLLFLILNQRLYPQSVSQTSSPVFRGFVVNTSGCGMLHDNITDEFMSDFIYEPNHFECQKPLLRLDESGSQLSLNMNANELHKAYRAKLTDLHCFYRQLWRENATAVAYGPEVPLAIGYEKTAHLPPGIEFIRVGCRMRQESVIMYTNFHFIAQSKRSPPPLSAAPVQRVSVLVLSLAGMSHLNFLRQMPLTAHYIQRRPHVEFWGYNKVADGTFENMAPLLGGKTARELAQSCGEPSLPWLDNCSFVWQQYKAADYQTAYIEDDFGTLFNYAGYGFRDQPTDYYLPPLLREMYLHLNVLSDMYGRLCTGPQRSFDIPLDVLRRLRPLMREDDFFTFAMTSALTVDDLNMPALMDTELLALLDSFERDGVLERTVVLLISDQGQSSGHFRKTAPGAMEARQPLLIALYPNWMEDRYAAAVDNLKRNAHRLVTPFDVHATLLDLLDLHQQLPAKRLEQRSLELDRAAVLPRGISLFLAVPERRRCQDAGIAAHWCTCLLRQPLLKFDRRVQRAAAFIISQINAMLVEFPACHQLSLLLIHDATIAVPHREELRQASDSGVDITVRLMTMPGMAVYEGTVHIYNNTLEMAGGISALNSIQYSGCIGVDRIRPYCYCKGIVMGKVKLIVG